MGCQQCQCVQLLANLLSGLGGTPHTVPHVTSLLAPLGKLPMLFPLQILRVYVCGTPPAHTCACVVTCTYSKVRGCCQCCHQLLLRELGILARTLNSQHLPAVTDGCLRAQLVCVLGIQIQCLVLVHRAPYPQNHLRAPPHGWLGGLTGRPWDGPARVTGVDRGGTATAFSKLLGTAPHNSAHETIALEKLQM